MRGGFKANSTRNVQELFHYCGCKEDGEKLGTNIIQSSWMWLLNLARFIIVFFRLWTLPPVLNEPCSNEYMGCSFSM